MELEHRETVDEGGMLDLASAGTSFGSMHLIKVYFLTYSSPRLHEKCPQKTRHGSFGFCPAISLRGVIQFDSFYIEPLS